MYKVKRNNGEIEIFNKLKYVCNQKNGVVILCNEEKAQGIVSNDNSTIYAFENTALARDYEVVTMEEIDDFEYWTQQQITDMELAMAEIYEMVLGGNE